MKLCSEGYTTCDIYWSTYEILYTPYLEAQNVIQYFLSFNWTNTFIIENDIVINNKIQVKNIVDINGPLIFASLFFLSRACAYIWYI